MEMARNKVRILLIRPWTERLAPLRAALRAAGIETQIVRVDIEPALNAALSRSAFDFVVFDPHTPGITHDVIAMRLRDNHRTSTVVAFESIETVIATITRVLADRMN